MNFRLFGDNIQLGAEAYIKNQNPVFYFRHFHSKHYWWNNDDLKKEFKTRILGTLKSQKFGTEIMVGVENIKNYTYLASTGENKFQIEGSQRYKNNASIKQCESDIQVFTAVLNQKLRAGIFHLDGEVAYQNSTNKEALPLPKLSMYGNLYLKTDLAKKAMQLELGADVRYFTKYYAPDYSPVIGQFYTQNPNDLIEIGSYPIVNVYANIHLNSFRFYVMMSHINQGSGKSNYFLAPHYPINPKMLKIGISWSLFD